ncbi:MAG TPA: TadE/TadG family type IV pilus assembly protein [Micromonosporaceae bacterium]
MVHEVGQLRDRGAAAVEFALLLPVVLLIIFGIIDFGRMLNAQLTLTQAAREGARATALFDETQGAARVQRAAQGLGTVESDIDQCPSQPGPEHDAQVTVTYDFTFVTPLGFIAGWLNGANDTIELTGQGVMPCLH